MKKHFKRGGRGGNRPGSGRKKGPSRKRVTLYLTPETLAEIGPSPALKIRELIERICTNPPNRPGRTA